MVSFVIIFSVRDRQQFVSPLFVLISCKMYNVFLNIDLHIKYRH